MKTRKEIDKKYYEEHRDVILQKHRESYYRKKNGVVEKNVGCITVHKLKKRLQNQEKNYNFKMMKFHLEEWSRREKTSVMEQCYKYGCLKEYFDYRMQHPDYDNSSDYINKIWGDSVKFKN